MKDEKETRKKLLESAKAEFSEKGFMKASLRNICSNAGVTTGALYFFFKDKEELFESLIKEPVQYIFSIMQEHFDAEKQLAKEGNLINDNNEDDADTYLQIVNTLYEYREELLLLVTKAQGSAMEKVVDSFIDMSEKHYRMLADEMSRQCNREFIDDKIIHWIAHIQTDTFIYMITHIQTKEEALEYINHTVTYMISGWYGMFGLTPGNQ